MSIVVENLSYTYMKGSPFEKLALKKINLDIKTGEFVGIIGQTGSGKSTLVQHFNGLLKPTEGKVYVNGTDTSGKNLKILRNQVGIVFQFPEHQLFEETVYKDIGFGPLKQGLDNTEINKRVSASIKAVGLKEDILEKSPFELSGGQKRRVAIAGVLAMNPGILVLDEPAAGLDPAGRDEIFAYISDLHKKRGITIILVSHSMEVITKMVDRVIIMKDGAIQTDGNTEEVFKNVHLLEDAGLSVPQITGLLKKLKNIIPELDDSIITVNEAKKEIIKFLKGK